MVLIVFSINYDYVYVLRKRIPMQITQQLVPKRNLNTFVNVFSINYDNVCALCKCVKMQITLQLVPKCDLNAFEWF